MVHIGKSSLGWTFSFHGRDEGAEGIESWADWRARLREGGRIMDEYGRAISFEEFAALVVSKHLSGRNNHTTYCRIHHPERAARSDVWLDPEGHSFSRGVFS